MTCISLFFSRVGRGFNISSHVVAGSRVKGGFRGRGFRDISTLLSAFALLTYFKEPGVGGTG